MTENIQENIEPSGEQFFPSGETETIGVCGTETKESPPSREQTPLKGIHELYIIVHALSDTVYADVPESLDDLHGLRRKILERIVEKFTPRRNDDVFVYMPFVSKKFEDWRDEVNMIRERKQQDPRLLMWSDMYRAVRSAAPRRNVILGPDLVYDENGDIKALDAALAKRGFCIGEDTTITMGGQYLELCLTSAALFIFKLPQVSTLRIDKSASLQRGYRQGTPFSTTEFRNYFETKGFSTTEDDEYIYIRRKNMASQRGSAD